MDVVWLFARLCFLALMFMYLCAVACLSNPKSSNESLCLALSTFNWSTSIIRFLFYAKIQNNNWQQQYSNEPNKWSLVFYCIKRDSHSNTIERKQNQEHCSVYKTDRVTVYDAAKGTAIVIELWAQSCSLSCVVANKLNQFNRFV